MFFLFFLFPECTLLHNPLHRPNIDCILKSDWVQQNAKKPPQSPSEEAKRPIKKSNSFKKNSFWCTKSRKTSPMSPNQPLKQPEPIRCYTKKYNNIPVDKFKNPLEQENNSLSSATTVIPINNHLSTIKRNNSLINSSKIVNRNQKNDAVEIVQNNDIIQVKSLRSYSNDDPSLDDEISTESEKDFERYMMLPTQTNGDANLMRTLNPMEKEVRKLMNTYGINDKLLEKNVEYGPRSEIIGIYRILLMRLKTQKEQASITNCQSPADKNQANSDYKFHKSQRKKHMCAIL